MILILSGALLCISGLSFVIGLNHTPMEQLRLYIGGVLIFLSLLLAGSNLVLTKHPLHEYWLIVIIGSTIGVCYVS